MVYGDGTIHTVYIKTRNSYINADHISRIWSELNQIMVLTSNSYAEAIFVGNTDNANEKIEGTLSLIDEAKRKSESSGDVIILDISKHIRSN